MIETVGALSITAKGIINCDAVQIADLKITFIAKNNVPNDYFRIILSSFSFATVRSARVYPYPYHTYHGWLQQQYNYRRLPRTGGARAVLMRAS